jgi:hypothetical protein
LTMIPAYLTHKKWLPASRTSEIRGLNKTVLITNLRTTFTTRALEFKIVMKGCHF